MLQVGDLSELAWGLKKSENTPITKPVYLTPQVRYVGKEEKECRDCGSFIPRTWFAEVCSDCIMFFEEGGSG